MYLSNGTDLGRYTVEARLGTGGMATVYRVRHSQLGSLHAMKVLTWGDEKLQKRLMAEGRAQASLHHPNIVPVTDVLEVHEVPALIMEYVDGPSLGEILSQRRLTVAQADSLGEGILAGMVAAHHHGLVHRDLKPGNILCQMRGGNVIPRIMDFGLVKILREDDATSQLTGTGKMMGTPAYMAPEQMADASRVDHRADIFSLGVLLYILVTGERPFSGDPIVAMRKVLDHEFAPVETVVPDLPLRMVDAINRAMQFDPDDRPQQVVELLALWRGVEVDAITDPVGPWGEAMGDLEGLFHAGGSAATGSITLTESEASDASTGEEVWPEPHSVPSRATPVIALLGVVGLLVIAGVTAVAVIGLVGVGQLGQFAAPAPAPVVPSPIEVAAPAPEADIAPEPDPPAPKPPVRASPAPAPAPTRAPAKAPEPEPEAEPAEEIWMATVKVSGEVHDLWLESGDERYPAGKVPAGTYTVRAFFTASDTAPATVGQLTIGAGETKEYKCSASLGICR